MGSLRFRLIVYCRRYFTESLTRIPDLEYDIKDAPVDFPWCAAEDIEARINEFNVTSLGSMSQISLLLLRIFEAHSIR
jgi:hypothetical protein